MGGQGKGGSARRIPSLDRAHLPFTVYEEGGLGRQRGGSVARLREAGPGTLGAHDGPQASRADEHLEFLFSETGSRESG